MQPTQKEILKYTRILRDLKRFGGDMLKAMREYCKMPNFNRERFKTNWQNDQEFKDSYENKYLNN